MAKGQKGTTRRNIPYNSYPPKGEPFKCEDGSEICGAESKSFPGTRCEDDPHVWFGGYCNGRCRTHGGTSTGAPQIHGRASKFHNQAVFPNCALVEPQELLSLKNLITVVELRMNEVWAEIAGICEGKPTRTRMNRLAPLWAQWKALGDELKGHTLAESSILHDRARALNEAEALRRADAVANAVIDVFTNTQLGLTQEQQNLALSIVRLTFASGEVRTQNS